MLLLQRLFKIIAVILFCGVVLKGPACIEDARKGILCEKCEEKLALGKFSPLDFEVLKAIVSLDNIILFSDLEFSKCVEMENYLLLFCSGKIGALIGKDGKNVKELGEKLKHLNKRLKIIERTSDERKIAQELIGKDAKLIALSKKYSAQGIQFKAMVSQKDKSKMLAGKEQTEQAMQELLGTKTKIEFV